MKLPSVTSLVALHPLEPLVDQIQLFFKLVQAVARRVEAAPRARAEERDEECEHSAAAKAKYRAGVHVSFRAQGGRRLHGTIAKMNPKRAKVEYLEGIFLVPYVLLEHGDDSS